MKTLVSTCPQRKRFAILPRVSTERQEKEGESLRAQVSEMTRAVGMLDGLVTAQYGGQEHATPGSERAEIERLLADAQKHPRLFDAVMVASADRWSRDNIQSAVGLEMLQKSGVDFYVGLTRYDLALPEHKMVLGMFSVFGEFQARHQSRKSMLSRIHRAKRGLPTCGKLPYGRRLQDGKLVVDPEKKRIIEDVASRYLAGERLPDLAIEYGMNHANLHKILMKRSGTEWAISFASDSASISEKVTFSIPRLLDDATIKAIRAKAEANRTYQHGFRKHRYLFNRMVFCAHCGYAMFGQTNHGKHQFYRHNHAERDRRCTGPSIKSWIRCDELEDVVFRHLFESFGNPAAIQRAINRATPNRETVKATLAQIARLQLQCDKIHAARGRILRLVSEGSISHNTAKGELARLDEQERSQTVTLAKLQASVAHLPSVDDVRTFASTLARRVSQPAGESRRASPKVYRKAKEWAQRVEANTAFESMTWDDKRSLAEMVFSGRTATGARMGIYIEWLGRGKWRYSITGHLIDEKGLLPMRDSRKHALFAFGGARLQRALMATVTNSAPD